MAYVPGYQHDVFVSYAHGDDRQWLERLVTRLEIGVSQRVGVKVSFWMDADSLPRSQDFTGEIPESLRASATLLFFPSPSFVRSTYCVKDECGGFGESLPTRRGRFGGGDFHNDLFAFRCPILPVDGNEHWTLLPGLTDIPFCNESETFAPTSPELEAAFRKLTGEIVTLLKRMRNASTAVFLYPPEPGPAVKPAHEALVAELTAQSYRVLPDRTVNIVDQVREASLSIILLDAGYDESARGVVEAMAAQAGKPWIVWCSREAEQTTTPLQAGFIAYLDQLSSQTKTYLNSAITTTKLKEEVLALLRPSQRSRPTPTERPRVYLIYNARDRAEVKNAGLISFHFQNDVEFDHPDDPAQHTQRLSGSDGVLLVWGSSDEDWCSREFAEMMQTARKDAVQGLCLFDPQAASKADTIKLVRENFQRVYVGQQFGHFDPAGLSGFFSPLLRRTAEARP